mgnify:CR=1 FL=1
MYKKKLFESQDEFEARIKSSDQDNLAGKIAAEFGDVLKREADQRRNEREAAEKEKQRSKPKPEEAKVELYKNIKNDKNLVERGGLHYEINSQVPFTGVGVKEVKKIDFIDEYKKTDFKDGKKDGIEEIYWKNNQLKSKSNFKEGLLDGFYEAYFSDGSLLEKTGYKEGKIHGFYESKFRNGQLETKAKYHMNKKLIEFERSYFENGQAKREADINFERSCILDGQEVGKSDINNGIDRICSVYEYRDNGEMILAHHYILEDGYWVKHGRQYEIRDFERRYESFDDGTGYTASARSEQIVSKYDKGIKLEEWLYGIKPEATDTFNKCREKRFDRAEEQANDKARVEQSTLTLILLIMGFLWSLSIIFF